MSNVGSARCSTGQPDASEARSGCTSTSTAYPSISTHKASHWPSGDQARPRGAPELATSGTKRGCAFSWLMMMGCPQLVQRNSLSLLMRGGPEGDRSGHREIQASPILAAASVQGRDQYPCQSCTSPHGERREFHAGGVSIQARTKSVIYGKQPAGHRRQVYCAAGKGSDAATGRAVLPLPA